MLAIGRLKFFLLGVLFFCYIIGVVVLSAVSLHSFKRGDIQLSHHKILLASSNRPLVRRDKPLLTRVKNYDYSVGAFRPILKISQIQWCSELKYFPVDYAYERPVALVSSPGSGNTWLRYLLQQATGIYTGSVYKDYGLLKNGFPAESISNGSVLAVKTHEWGPKAQQMFSKAILLIRSPDKSIQAEFNRQSGGHIGFASPDRYRRTKGKYWQQFFKDNLRGWQQLNLDWIHNFSRPLHVMFYHDLVADTERSLKSVINFLGVFVPNSKFKCALERKEGIYRRRRRILNFDPFSVEMKLKSKEAENRVYSAIYNIAASQR